MMTMSWAFSTAALRSSRFSALARWRKRAFLAQFPRHARSQPRELILEDWMDHEFGSGELQSDQVGWDWFSIQLDDGRESSEVATGRRMNGRDGLTRNARFPASWRRFTKSALIPDSAVGNEIKQTFCTPSAVGRVTPCAPGLQPSFTNVPSVGLPI